MSYINLEDLVKRFSLNKYTLLFDKNLENEYQDWQYRSSIKMIRLFLFITMVLYIIGSLLDVSFKYETAYLHKIGLYIIIPFFVVFIISTYFDFFKKFHQILLSFTYLFSGFGLTLMMVDQPDNFIYAMGLMMVFSAGFFILNIKFIYASITAILSLIVLNVAISIFANIDHYFVVAYNFFYSSIIIINMIAAYFIELYHKKNYVLNKLLNEEKIKLENESNQRNKDLQETENKLSILVENAFDGIYILDNKKYEYVNKSFSKITGYTFEELTSPSFDFNVLLTDRGREFMNERYRLREAGKKLPDRYEIEIVSKDGENKYLEVTTVSIGNPGQVKVFGIMRDITDRIMANEIFTSQNEFRKILVDISTKFINLSPQDSNHAINEALVVMSNYVKADRAYIFNLDFKSGICDNTFEYCNNGIEPYIDELQNIKLGEDFLESFGKNEHVYIPDVAKLPEGYTKDVLEPQGIKSLIAVPMTHDEIPIGFVGFDFVNDYHVYSEADMQILNIFSHLLVNIRLKIEYENKLIDAKVKAEESDKLKSAFLANLSHEIRTPMNGIIGFMNLLKLPDLTDEERNEYIKMINMSGSRLLNTLDDIIEISHIDSGLAILESNSVDLNSELIKHAEIWDHKAYEKGLKYSFSINLPDDKSIVKTDIKKLLRMINHLINNSIKFTTEGSIQFDVFYEEPNVVIRIKDTGIGIPANMHNKIFERFVQADYSLARGYEGSGLGLAIVQEYAKMLDLKIKLESEIDKGSTFYIII